MQEYKGKLDSYHVDYTNPTGRFPEINKVPNDYRNFVQTYKYFLDHLLIDFSQNYDTHQTYEEFLKKDNMTEKIRHSCASYIMRRIHSNFFIKMNPSEYDNQAFKVMQRRRQ